MTAWWRKQNKDTLEFLDITDADDITGPEDFPKNDFCYQCFEEMLLRWNICLKNNGSWVFDSQVKDLRQKRKKSSG